MNRKKYFTGCILVTLIGNLRTDIDYGFLGNLPRLYSNMAATCSRPAPGADGFDSGADQRRPTGTGPKSAGNPVNHQ